MPTVAKCKSIWDKMPQKAKGALLFLPLTLPAFFMSPAYVENLFITGYEDTVFHILFFGFLAYLFSGRKGALILCCLVLMGVTIEMVQALLPHRSASLSDILANSAGVLLGVMAQYLKA